MDGDLSWNIRGGCTLVHTAPLHSGCMGVWQGHVVLGLHGRHASAVLLSAPLCVRVPAGMLPPLRELHLLPSQTFNLALSCCPALLHLTLSCAHFYCPRRPAGQPQ